MAIILLPPALMGVIRESAKRTRGKRPVGALGEANGKKGAERSVSGAMARNGGEPLLRILE